MVRVSCGRFATDKRGVIQRLPPYSKGGAPDELRRAFELPTWAEVHEAADKLRYPRLPSLNKMWVKNPEKAPQVPKHVREKFDGMTWK